jgi:hypothetical protein
MQLHYCAPRTLSTHTHTHIAYTRVLRGMLLCAVAVVVGATIALMHGV